MSEKENTSDSMKLFLVSTSETNSFYVAANSWERIGQIYERAINIKLVSDKIMILKPTTWTSQ